MSVVRKCMHSDIRGYGKINFEDGKYIEFFGVHNGRVRYIPLPTGVKGWNLGYNRVMECNVTLGGIPEA